MRVVQQIEAEREGLDRVLAALKSLALLQSAGHKRPGRPPRWMAEIGRSLTVNGKRRGRPPGSRNKFVIAPKGGRG